MSDLRKLSTKVEEKIDNIINNCYFYTNLKWGVTNGWQVLMNT